MLIKTSVLVILLGINTITNGQDTAQSRAIPRFLLDCYREPNILQRDNRLPMTINTLIELIKKVEETPGLNMGLQDIAVSLIHRFKQDGIEKISGIKPMPGVIPYKPSGFQFSKHKILLTKLLPGNAERFPNETLSIEEQCALHFMLSSSIELQVRGDEPQMCGQLAQYRTNRIPRSMKDDVEIVHKVKQHRNVKASMMQAPDVDNTEADDYDQEEREVDEDNHRAIDFGFVASPDLISQCPVENGVIKTKYGAVNAGTLLAGIATGLNPQAVRVVDIIPKSRNIARVQQTSTRVVDNRWAATLAGDLSEVALLLGAKNGIQVGAKGVS